MSFCFFFVRLTSGTCGTAALATPLEVVEASCIGASLPLGTIFTLIFCDFLGVIPVFSVSKKFQKLKS